MIFKTHDNIYHSKFEKVTSLIYIYTSVLYIKKTISLSMGWIFSSKNTLHFFCCFRTGFRPTKGERLIWLVHRGMRTSQMLFHLRIEPGIPRVRLWELLVTGVQATWLKYPQWVYLYLLFYIPIIPFKQFFL